METTRCATRDCTDDMTICRLGDVRGPPTRRIAERSVTAGGAVGSRKCVRRSSASWVSGFVGRACAYLGLWLSVLTVAEGTSAENGVLRLDGEAVAAEVNVHPDAHGMFSILHSRCGGAWSALDTVATSISEVSCTNISCGAKACAHATAPLRNVAWLRLRGGGEEAGWAWPRGRDSQ